PRADSGPTMIGTVPAGLETHAPGRDGVRTDRIRVLQFLPNFALGGTEGLTVSLARALDPVRFDVQFGCLRRWGELLGEVADRGIPIAERSWGSGRALICRSSRGGPG